MATNHERVNKALDLLRSGLAAFVLPQVPEGPEQRRLRHPDWARRLRPRRPSRQDASKAPSPWIRRESPAMLAPRRATPSPRGSRAKPPKQNARLLDEPERRALFAFAGASGLG